MIRLPRPSFNLLLRPQDMLLSDRSGSQHRHCDSHSIKALGMHLILVSLNKTVCKLYLSVVACCVWRVVARRQEVFPVDERQQQGALGRDQPHQQQEAHSNLCARIEHQRLPLHTMRQ